MLPSWEQYIYAAPQEVTHLASNFGLDIAAIDTILLNGIRRSFLPEPRRQQLEGGFQFELSALKTKHLTDRTGFPPP